MQPGEYDIYVKGLHTLSVKKRVKIRGGLNRISFGVLPEGDANYDDQVDEKDFAVLKKAFDSRRGEKKYNRRADFNQDGKINILDFSLMAKNWGKKGAGNR